MVLILMVAVMAYNSPINEDDYVLFFLHYLDHAFTLRFSKAEFQLSALVTDDHDLKRKQPKKTAEIQASFHEYL